MNPATKAKIANILTALASIVAIVQTSFLTNPPFTVEQIAFWGAVFTYISLVSTAIKQYFSPDVSNTGGQITIALLVATTLTGLLDLIPAIHFSDTTSVRIKWGITVAVAIINILSKTIFPSDAQKDKMFELKKQ